MGASSFTLFIGLVFGLALAAPPGPMNAIIAEETIVRSFRAGVKAGAGAMAADICFFTLAILGMGSFVIARPRLQAVMIGIGGILMLVFGYQALRESITQSDWGTNQSGSHRGFWKTFVLGITNPYQLAFWLTVGIALLRPEQLDIGTYLPVVSSLVIETGQPMLFIGLFAGIVLWILAFPAALRTIGDRIDRFAPLIAGLSACILLGFGGWFLVDALRIFV